MKKPKRNSNMSRLNFFIPQQQREGLERLSRETGLPLAELIRRAIANLLKSESKN